jgi:DNA helicase II / ATP-dependent DNA helicase PcrA
MVANNTLTLAVAGSRKTQGIVDACAAADKAERILVLSYTTANQVELRRRLATYAGDHPQIEVSGWFSFLVRNFVRPFLPFVYEGERMQGFDFKSPPQQGTRTDERRRYFNHQGEVRKVHLPQLADWVEELSGRAGIRRLERVYDRIFIDEVQDLCGYDLEILSRLMDSSIPLEMVGDIRQAILATNERENKNRKFIYMGIWGWFKAQEKSRRLVISQRCKTWRCSPLITELADSLFGAEWGFGPTISMNARCTDHDGVFLVRSQDVKAYVDQFEPMALRYSAGSGKMLPLEYITFGNSKGLSRERVLIFPTQPISNFLSKGTTLTASQSARFYVAATRAEQSVAIILDKPGECSYPYWLPN